MPQASHTEFCYGKKMAGDFSSDPQYGVVLNYNVRSFEFCSLNVPPRLHYFEEKLIIVLDDP